VWADDLAKKILQKKCQKNVVATGITPSGFVHTGNLREVTVGDVCYKALRKNKLKAEFIYIADDFDRLRKLYPFLPKEFERYVGMPLSKIPDPMGDCHVSYSEHFLADFYQNLPILDINPQTISATKLYEAGQYTELIKIALQKKEEIKKILEDVSHRKLDSDWSPFNPLCKKCGRIDQAKVTGLTLEENQVEYKCACGNAGIADFSKGQGKLYWRIDWPARWKIFGVVTEPFGKEHAAAGGSYETAKLISQRIFDYNPPEGVFYEFIYLKGTKGKMSSSLGNVISVTELLKIIPPEIARYLLIKNKDRHVTLDLGENLIRLIGEFNRLEQKVDDQDATDEEEELYNYCKVSDRKSRPHIPFGHLATILQSANGDINEITRLLKRTEYFNFKDEKILQEDLQRAKYWLQKYAPDNYKFSVQKETPKKLPKFNPKQIDLFKKIAQIFQKNQTIDPEKLHNQIYETGKDLGLTPKETFEPFYLIFIDQNHGPKLGWFLAGLDREFVVKRLEEVIK
jgi:lysyl-tRNA synthetase class 1